VGRGVEHFDVDVEAIDSASGIIRIGGMSRREIRGDVDVEAGRKVCAGSIQRRMALWERLERGANFSSPRLA